ncbi:3-oxoadipate enol-lactonase [Terriglobus albidus]|uniref:3-oxoadipate enol-lactonase n=1 Tax=Terriglobus albidus TaxID=1592106 RepID=UPI0021E07E9C|nr:3-oxoadipate enol-lactonase [Terriglobus albidus]
MLVELGSEETIYYEAAGPEGAPAVVFSHSLGQGTYLWNAQAEYFSCNFRTVVYEQRGFGRSSSQQPPNTVAGMGKDVLALMDRLGIAKAHFCGISIGGMVGLWLGVNAADRIGKLVLSNTAAKIGTAEFWQKRAEDTRLAGIEQFLPGSAERWLTADFREEHPEVVRELENSVRRSSIAGYAAGCEVLATMDLRDAVSQIKLPVLCIAGNEDPTTPPVDQKFLVEQIPSAKYLELPSGHLSCINRSALWNQAVMEFLGN